MQYALINSNQHTVARYMPSNYAAFPLGNFMLVYGEDNAGWTLDGYVLPRLASGLFYPVRDALVEYRDGTFALIDPKDEFGVPVDEVRIFTQYDWEAQVNLGKHPVPEGYDGWNAFFVVEEVSRIVNESRPAIFDAFDPTFDPDAAAQYANNHNQAQEV